MCRSWSQKLGGGDCTGAGRGPGPEDQRQGSWREVPGRRGEVGAGGAFAGQERRLGGEAEPPAGRPALLKPEAPGAARSPLSTATTTASLLCSRNAAVVKHGCLVTRPRSGFPVVPVMSLGASRPHGGSC